MPGGIHPPIEVIGTWHFNYANPKTSGFYIVVIVGALLGLSYLTVALRLVARLYFHKNFGIDDGLIVFNMIPLTGMAIGVMLAITKFGFNRHLWEVETPVLIQARKITLAIEIMYMVSTCTTKASILLFYRRLAADTISRRFLYFVYASIAYVAIYFIVLFSTLCTSCHPLSTYWKLADYICATQDFLACGLPMILLWKLQMDRRTKIGLYCLFGVGFFLCICAVLRAYYVYRVYHDTYDMTYGAQPAWLWLAVEAELAIVCASVPALRKFFQGLSKALSTQKSSQNSGSAKTQLRATSLVHERKASVQLSDLRSVNFYIEHSSESEQEIVSYEHQEKRRPLAVGETFYDDRDDDAIGLPYRNWT